MTPPSFLSLPAEIREHIYSEVLSNKNSRCKAESPYEAATYKFHLEVLLVNHQIHHEAKKIFQDNIFVKVTTPWPEAISHIRSEGKVPSVTTGDKAGNFRGFHLWVFIDTPAIPYERHQAGFSMLICFEDLPLFTRMWRFANLNHIGLNQHLRLKLTVQDPHVPDRKIPKALQSQLLLPFGVVKDLYEFSIEGPKLLDSVKESLKTQQDIPDLSPEECLDKGFTLKDAGNQLLKAGSCNAALEKYVESFEAIHITVRGRVRHIHAEGYYVRELTSGVYKGARGDYVRMILRVQLVANVVYAYLKLNEWAEAHFWGKRTIILFRQSVTGDDSDDIGDDDPQSWLNQTWAATFPAHDAMGKIFYRTALASRELGKIADVKTLMKAAAISLPHDRNIQDEMKSMDEAR